MGNTDIVVAAVKLQGPIQLTGRPDRTVDPCAVRTVEINDDSRFVLEGEACVLLRNVALGQDNVVALNAHHG